MQGSQIRGEGKIDGLKYRKINKFKYARSLFKKTLEYTKSQNIIVTSEEEKEKERVRREFIKNKRKKVEKEHDKCGVVELIEN